MSETSAKSASADVRAALRKQGKGDVIAGAIKQGWLTRDDLIAWERADLQAFVARLRAQEQEGRAS